MTKYDVVYADPPWSYDQKSVGRGNKSGALDKYKLMTLDDIKSLPIDQITNDNAALFIWATVPLLPEALSVIPEWGFKYKSMIIWEKTGLLGMGNWVRVQEELLLIAIKGRVKPFAHQEKNIYRHPICDHSAKPHFFRGLVCSITARSFPSNASRLELFARSREGMFSDYEYEGWHVFGNQVNNSIEMPIK